MKTNWWILDIWNRCVTVGRPPVLELEANAAACQIPRKCFCRNWKFWELLFNEKIVKTNWWILDIWNRCVTLGRPPVLEANAAAYGGFDYVVREHRAVAASCKAVQPLFCWEE